MKHLSLKKKIIVSFLFVFAILIVVGFINPLTITHYDITSKQIPASFDEYSIVQISDFHLKSFGSNEKRLISKIKECNPDLIVFTGDMVDEDHNSTDNLSSLVEGISDIAPIYQVTGNHERANMVNFSNACNIYSKFNVIDINDKSIEITKDNDSIILAGIDYNTSPDNWNTLIPDAEKFSILLYHNAAAFDKTSLLGFDLILSGHTHGGIIRLPFIGGLLNTDVSFGAEYEAGVYEKNGATLISNRGLGNSTIPRFNNSREVVNITLHSAS